MKTKPIILFSFFSFSMLGVLLTCQERAESQVESIPSSQTNLIAIIDTGIDTKNPALESYLWQNPGESGLDKSGHDKASNGIDDDGNGYIDDVHGWNFADDNDDLTDRHGHGTHIAGLITGESSKLKTKTTGTKIMILKYFNPSGQGKNSTLQASLEALRYAIQMGAKIINYSGGGNNSSSQERQLVELAERNNILLVAAAGNESSLLSEKPFFPALYRNKNILVVAALKKNGMRLPSSNYGSEVDLYAPGEQLKSTWPNQRQEQMLSGTSQATAIVTHHLALLMEENPKQSSLQLKEKILRYQSQKRFRTFDEAQPEFPYVASKGTYQSLEQNGDYSP